MRFETRDLEKFLATLDELKQTENISIAEYIQICLLLKIYEKLHKEDPLK